MATSRKGADYCAVGTRNDPWGRRTSAGAWYFGAEFIRYEPRSSVEPMRLFHINGGGFLPKTQGSVVVLMRTPYVANFLRLNGHHSTTIAEGPKCELWDLFLAHGRMLIAGGNP